MTATMNPRVAKFDKDLRIIMLAFAREFPFWGFMVADIGVSL